MKNKIERKKCVYLSDSILNKYKDKTIPWGFNGLGYIVYKRCVDIETPVLCGNLTWKKAGDLKINDDIIGFDAEPVSKVKNKTRYLRMGKVTYNKIEEAECLGIELEDGTILYSTPEHSWLVKFKDNDILVWRETKDLEKTKYGGAVYLLRTFGKPWKTDKSYEAGYLAGAYDGEGNLDDTNGFSFSQVKNNMLEKVETFLKDKNIKYAKRIKSSNTTYLYKNKRKECFSLRTHGIKNIFRFLGIIRPERLLNKFINNLDIFTNKKFGKQMRCNSEDYIKVKRVFSAGKRKIAVLSTSIETHFTGGFASHNTYSRLKENGIYEEWPETILRCINGAQKIGADYTKEEMEKLFDYMFNLKCNLAGRMLWQLGTDGIDRYGGNALLNCWFTVITQIKDFCFLFENLMLGGGVGFSVRREDIHELPKVKEGVIVTHENTNDADFIVPDSREGWVKLLYKTLKSFFVTGKSFSYSTILVRGYGEVIKGFGGTSSGPKILVEGIGEICQVIKSRENKKLRSVDVLDICNIIGKIVVSGNVRRSAQIGLGDPDDYLFIRAKRWDLGSIPNWRSLSNNTIYADDFSHISNDIWSGYLGNGEPYGFYNVKLSQKKGRLGDNIKDSCEGLNPCFTGDTLVDTPYGKIEIKELADKVYSTPVYCYDGEKISISTMKNIRRTGVNREVWKVTLDNGEIIKSTPNHRFMLRDGNYKELKDLKLGESLMPFRRFKRNSKGYNQLSLNNGTYIGEAQLVAEWKYKRKMKKGECVHHIDGNKKNNRPDNLDMILISEHNSNHIKGDNNPIRRFPEKNPMKLYPDMFKNEKNPRWNNKIKVEDVASLKKEGLTTSQIAKKLKTTYNIVKKRLELCKLDNHKVRRIELCGREDVYDGEVEFYHNFALSSGVIVHNCGEITLSDKECCNLSELYLNNIESKEELIDCASLLYKAQKAVCSLDFIHEETNKIVHKNFRIGLGVTGICQSLDKLKWLDPCYNKIRKLDEEWSKIHNYPTSIKMTTIKPSGTLSLLAGSTPGIHPAFSKYYMRRIRMASSDKLVAICEELGYEVNYVENFDGTKNHETVVVKFPCYIGEKALISSETNAIKQLELVKKIMTVWADNSASVTVYYKKEELKDIKSWLKENYKHSIKSISFLLHKEHGFSQAPYEEITQEEYEKTLKKIKPIKEVEVDNSDGLDVEDCAGSCPIK